VVYRTDWANPNMGYVYKGSPLSDKRPHGFGRVPAQASGLKPSCWKAECVERRPLRLEGGKDCKVLPILTVEAKEIYMVRRWEEEVERLSGTGTLSDSHGHSEKLAYVLVVRQNMRERPSLNKPTEIVGGNDKLSGSVVVGNAFGTLDLQGNLVLRIEDGREVEIILTTISDPFRPCLFLARNRTFFPGQ